MSEVAAGSHSTRKNKRQREDVEQMIPSNETFRQMVNQSFFQGDHYASWRNRFVRTFAVGYTQSLIRDCTSQFLSKNEGTISLSDVRKGALELTLSELGDFGVKHPHLQIVCKLLEEHIVGAVNGTLKCSSLTSFFLHGYVPVTGVSNLANIYLPLNINFDFSTCVGWLDQSDSMIDILKRLNTNFATMPLYKLSSKEAGKMYMEELYTVFRNDTDFVAKIYTLNVEIYKNKIDALIPERERLLKLKERHTRGISDFDNKISGFEDVISQLEKQLAGFVENEEMRSLLNDTSEEYQTFISGMSDLIGGKLKKLRLKRDEVVRMKEEQMVFNNEKMGKMLTLLSDVSIKIDTYAEVVSYLTSKLDDVNSHEVEKEFLIDLYKWRVDIMEPVFEILNENMENVNLIIRVLSRIISSKELALEGIIHMQKDIQMNFCIVD